MTGRRGFFATWFLLAVIGNATSCCATEPAIVTQNRDVASPTWQGTTSNQGDISVPSSNASRLDVFVGIAPLACLVERMGGEHVVVHVLLQPGQNEHTFSLTPRQMLALGKARLFIKAGLPFENRLTERIQQGHPQLRVAAADKGIEKRISAEHCCHQLHDDHDHAAGEPDPHVWLSPPLLRIMAANVAESLAQADPGHASEYRQNLAALLRDIDRAHAKIASLLTPHRGQSFYVFHPAFGYFADAYGLRQEATEAEGKVPTPRQLRALIKRAKADGVKIIFVQPQFDQRSAQTVAAAIGGAVLPIDPLARDVVRNLEDVAARIAAAL